MARFYQALQKMNEGTADAAPAARLPVKGADTAPASVTAPYPAAGYGDISGEPAIRQLSEQLLAMSAGAGMQLIVTGCQPGDGASSIAGAIAADLAQRLAARAMLADSRTRTLAPAMLTAVGGPRRIGAPDSTGGAGADPAQFAPRIEQAAQDRSICIIDAGAIRLEPALLGAIDREAPVLIVARYGQTERKNLVRTMRAVRASGHRTLAIVFNAVRSPMPAAVHSLFQTGE